MLQSITASNIAIVHHLHIDLQQGFTTLTGETGAGKSLLLDALAFVLGARGQASLIRQGAEEATVTAVFNLPKEHLIFNYLQSLGLSGAETDLIIRRSLHRDGKNKAFINDIPTSLTNLKSVGDSLIEIHGQFDRLLLPSHHRALLDQFGNLTTLVESTRHHYEVWQKSVQSLHSFKAQIKEGESQKDYRDFCLQELLRINPRKHEESLLLEKRQKLMQKEKTATLIEGTLQELEKQHALQALANASRLLSQGTTFLSAVAKRIDEIHINLQDILSDLEQARNEFEEEDAENSLEQLEQRLHALRALAKKHACSVDDLEEILITLQKENQTFETSPFILRQLEVDQERYRKDYEKAASLLRQKREEAAKTLKEKVEEEFSPLKLQAQFFVHFSYLTEEQWSDYGTESTAFYIATNPGESPGPLSKIASGGEMARLMLALKVVLHQENQVPTLIFDEIDTGVGGAVADAMGKRLHTLAKNAQVLAVTHSPQVAAYGDHHYHVSKTIKEGRVETSINYLETEEQRIKELARMLSGSTITSQAQAAAEQLLKKGAL